MDWQTFFKELKDSGRGAGLFVLLMVGGFVCTVAIVFGGELFLDIDWLTLFIHSLQVVLALSICTLLVLPTYAWRSRRKSVRVPWSLGSYAPGRNRARKRQREDSWPARSNLASMDWESFFQGVHDTRTGLWILWLALAAVLLAAFGIHLVAEPVGGFLAWVVAVFRGIWEFADRQEPLEVASVVARCVLFLSIAALVVLPLLLMWDRSRRSKPSHQIDTARTARSSTHRPQREDS